MHLIGSSLHRIEQFYRALFIEFTRSRPLRLLFQLQRNLPQQLISNQLVRFGGIGSFGWLSDDFGPDGHVGDPTSATSDDGRLAFEAAIDMLAAALVEIRDFSLRRR